MEVEKLIVCPECTVPLKPGEPTYGALEEQRDHYKAEAERLKKLIWTPQTEEFLEAVRLEAAHQRDRWGDEHDGMKSDPDWFWTLGWLSGKAVHASDQEKRLHHLVTSAALLLNWHRFAQNA